MVNNLVNLQKVRLEIEQIKKEKKTRIWKFIQQNPLIL